MDNPEVLEEIRKSQHKTELLLTEIRGDNKVLSQVLAFHVEQLKEFKSDYNKTHDELAARVKKLEGWQIRVIGIATGAAAIISLVLNDVREALLK